MDSAGLLAPCIQKWVRDIVWALAKGACSVWMASSDVTQSFSIRLSELLEQQLDRVRLLLSISQDPLAGVLHKFHIEVRDELVRRSRHLGLKHLVLRSSM